MRAAVGNNGEAPLDEPQGLQEALPVTVDGLLSTDRDRGQVGATEAGTTPFPEGRGGTAAL